MMFQFQRRPRHLSVMVLLGDTRWGSAWFFIEPMDSLSREEFVGMCAPTSSLGPSALLGKVMWRFKSPPAFPWQTSLTSGGTQFEHGLLNSCSTMVLASETMNCKHSITLELQEFPPDLL